MQAQISYNADVNNNATQILADVTAILTGETVVGNLTGNIDVGASSINTTFETVAWTLYDDVSADTKVFRLPVHDDPTAYFYVEIFKQSVNEVHHRIWESWDNVTHAGTESIYYNSGVNKLFMCIAYSVVGFKINFTATARHLLCRSDYNLNDINYLAGFVQYDRGEVWDTVADGFKPVISTYNSGGFFSDRVHALPHRRSNGAVTYGALGIMYPATRYGTSQFDRFNATLGGNSGAARGLDVNGNSVHNMYEIGFSYQGPDERFLTGKAHDMYLATYQNGAFGDTVSIGGNTYGIWPTDANYRLAIRQG